MRKVTTGPADAKNTVILSGLTAGENVVIDGVDRLRDGAKVVVRNGGGAAAARARRRFRRRPASETLPGPGRRRAESRPDFVAVAVAVADRDAVNQRRSARR